MTMSKSRSPIHYDYHFTELRIERAEHVNDLGIIFNSKFTFTYDLSHRIAKAKSLIGFIKRQASDFKDPMVLKSLYFAFVRSKLEYCSQVWNCYQSAYYGEINGVRCLINKIERIQMNFTRFLTRTNENLINMCYEDRCKYYDLDSLRNRRVMASALMCFDILMGHVNSPNLLAELNMSCISTSVRRGQFLRLNLYRMNYGMNNPINVMKSCFNSFQDVFDFNYSKNHFKNEIKKKLRR